MMGKIKIDTIEQFQDLIEKHNKFVIFKNSVTCPISAAAFSQFDEFTNGHPEIAAYYLNVQESRSLSNYIAETYHIKHESPQVLLFENENVRWHTSHWEITKEALEVNILPF
ncbi:bacillithiol system redox-active protein YtxJ [Aeribacillus alveayuensis]